MKTERTRFYLLPNVLILMLLPTLHAVAQPSLQVSAAERLHLEESTIEVRGALPSSRVELGASLTDNDGRVWSSRATYHADAQGRVATATQAAVSGSYTGVDADGLIWSMLPVPPEALHAVAGIDPEWPRHPQLDTASVTIRFRARVRYGLDAADTTVLHAEQRVVFMASGVRRTAIEGQPFEGVLFEAAGPGPHPAVLVISGSGGGAPWKTAMFLASRGITALAVAHFAYPHRPDNLENIPLEYFHGATDWLRTRTGAPRIGLIGASRGGEGVLLLASSLPELYGAVVSAVPSNVVWTGCCAPNSFMQPAWSLRGAPIPGYIPPLTADGTALLGVHEDFVFHAGMLDPGEAAIPVERIQAPVLLLSCDSDELWPSTLGAEQVITRLRAHDFAYPAEHIAYRGAGHMAVSGMLVTSMSTRAIHPISKEEFVLGGTPALNAAADRDALPRAVQFLKAHLPVGTR
ncbi:MAG: acyl-CoA thioesterase/BAAT N-terminal domain-containing protein [Flavobacteriales bacterium]|nr:acyl-CoA thioesterase/BAAT N-terminal domain-containing protein [Flavobacteriales bacterium]